MERGKHIGLPVHPPYCDDENGQTCTGKPMCLPLYNLGNTAAGMDLQLGGIRKMSNLNSQHFLCATEQVTIQI